jgi:hypothetical protein
MGSMRLVSSSEGQWIAAGALELAGQFSLNDHPVAGELRGPFSSGRQFTLQTADHARDDAGGTPVYAHHGSERPN